MELRTMTRWIRVCILLAFMLVEFGCSSQRVNIRAGMAHEGARPGKILVAPLQWFHELEDTNFDSRFDAGNAVGFIHHKDGYIVPSDAGARVRSKTIAVSRESEFSSWLTDWHTRTLKKHFAGSYREPSAGTQVPFVPTPERIKRLGEVSETGKDNVNIPLINLSPNTFWKEGGELASNEGADVILVPVVVYFYAHNPGWFHGQTWGSSSGGRARIAWIAYRASDGGLAGWWDIEALFQEEEIRQPEQGVIEQIAQELLDRLTEGTQAGLNL